MEDRAQPEDIEVALAAIVGPSNLDVGPAVSDDSSHDESLTAPPRRPRAVVRPGTTEEVAAIVRAAVAHGVPLTARGSGTGLSGGAVPRTDGVVVSFERMNTIVEIDQANHVAVVEPGVTLAQLDAALAPLGLVYPVQPGEDSASLGGNVATNAGGMQAVKYGVTRHHVLGVDAVLGTGEVLSCGGRFVKATSGYDLTQLLIGSEGTLALITNVTLRLHPRPSHRATLLAPFASIEAIAEAVPPIVASGVGPLLVEYLDVLAMDGIVAASGLDLGVPADIKSQTAAYLVVVLEGHHEDRVDEDTAHLADQLSALGARDVYVLPPHAGADLITAREGAFLASKAAGADDLVDVVVPRASIPAYLDKVGRLAGESGTLITGCGHAGDGNVHLSIFQADPEIRGQVVHDVIAAGVTLGGAVSGEHGIGTAKLAAFAELEDPAKIALMRRIKVAFDPSGILNPGTIFDAEPAAMMSHDPPPHSTRLALGGPDTEETRP